MAKRINKPRAIIAKIVELANSGKRVTFEEDFGGNTLTVFIDGQHTHCGCPGAPLSNLIDGLYASLHGGPGLSWVGAESLATPPAPVDPQASEMRG